MVLYKFRCRCGDEYIGQTTRRLCKRVREHLPSWFGRRAPPEKIRSAVTQHLIDYDHHVNEQDAFSIIYRVPPLRYKSIRRRVLSIAEAIAIKNEDPSLCRQKRLYTSLLLPWPSSSVNCFSVRDNFVS